MALAVPCPAHASAQVSLDWVQPTRGASIALDAADNVYTVDYEQAPGAEMVLTKRDARGLLVDPGALFIAPIVSGFGTPPGQVTHVGSRRSDRDHAGHVLHV